MEEIKYDIVDVVEDVTKVGYSIGVFACRFFYQVSNLEALKNSMDAYKVSRFSQRLEYFTHEHEKLTENEKKEFYQDLKSNKQNLNYLYEVIEQARTTTYDLHAKILAILSCSLIQNKEFNFFESSLLANLHTLTYEDFINYEQVLREIHVETLKKGNNGVYGSVLTFKTSDYRFYISIQNFLNIGMLSYPEESFINVPTIQTQKPNGFRKSMDFVANNYSLQLMAILHYILASASHEVE
jgi:hypothetical protein